jgi:hypothetical protein
MRAAERAPGLLLTAVAALALALAPAAGAGPILERAAGALATDPVYVDPEASPALTPAEERRLEEAIATEGEGPIYVAVVPEAARAEAGGDTGEALRELAEDVGRRGVYALVAGGQFRAGATGDTGLDRGESGELATEAFQASGDDGVAATLEDFVERVGDARTSGAREGDGGDGGGGFPWWIAILVAGAVGYFLVRRRRREAAEQAELDEVKEAAREDLVALAADVQALEAEVEGNPPAKEAYLRALDHYSRASGVFDRVRTPDALEPVAKALEEGRYEMAVARAALAGEPPPERRAPCFFDPRHGPSVRDVPYSPFAGVTREVPVCAACATRIEEGEEPEPRQVLAGGRAMPYYEAGPAFGGYFGGFFPGIVLGQVLGGGFGGWDGSVGGEGGERGDGTSDDDGDFGGGFDSGDFGGGGDLGGGDFGGGDFGGGGGD